MSTQYPEEKESLWTIAASPGLWAAHFLLSYVTAAIWCAKLGTPDGSLAPVRALIALYTAGALFGIGATGWRGWRRHRAGESRLPHDVDSAEDRHRFLGFASFILSCLSAIAVAYTALTSVFIGTCR